MTAAILPLTRAALSPVAVSVPYAVRAATATHADAPDGQAGTAHWPMVKVGDDTGQFTTRAELLCLLDHAALIRAGRTEWVSRDRLILDLTV